MDFEIREDRERTRGRRALCRERAAYLRLVRQGLSNQEACRIVGIDSRTGRRWHNGRHPTGKHVGALPIASAAPPDVRGRYLNETERIHIADRVREKVSIREIAREFGRAPSTISREIRGNRHPGNGQYRPHAAQARADARRPRPKPSQLGAHQSLRQSRRGSRSAAGKRRLTDIKGAAPTTR
jgi:transposase, IS30 family